MITTELFEQPAPTKEFDIHQSMMPAFEQAIGKLNKKATKLGVAPITIMQLGSEWKEIKKAQELFIKVSIMGEAPKINGWEFVGTIDRETGTAIVKSMPGKLIPEQFRHSAGVCDHCHTARYRKETFIVRNIQSNEYKEVGRNCLKDFLGHTDPNAIAQYMSWWANMDEWMTAFNGDDDGENWGSNQNRLVHLMEFMAHVVCAVDKFGWVSGAKAREYNETHMEGFLSSTSSDVQNSMFNPRATKLPVTPENWETARKVIDWVRGPLNDKKNKNEYEYNLVAILSDESTTWKNLGYAASAYPAYQRFMDQFTAYQAKQKTAQSSEFQGKVGEKIERNVTVGRCKVMDGAYGTTTLVPFVDDEGNHYNWFASGDVTQTFPLDSKMKIRMTVKKHDVYNGVKNTYVLRVKVL